MTLRKQELDRAGRPALSLAAVLILALSLPGTAGAASSSKAGSGFREISAQQSLRVATTGNPASAPAEPEALPAAPAAPRESGKPLPLPKALPLPPAPAPLPRVKITLPPPAPLRITEDEILSVNPVARALRDQLGKLVGQRVKRNRAGRALKKRREAIAEYYKARRYLPLWQSAGEWNDAARSVLTRLKRAGEDGLDLSDFRLPALLNGNPEDQAVLLANAEIEMSMAVVAYARQATGSRMHPLWVSRLITMKPEVAGAVEVLSAVSTARDAAARLHDFNPPHKGYRALREKLAELRAKMPDKPLPKISYGRVLKVGMKDKRVPLIRARFGLSPKGEGEEDEIADPTLYDTRVASAVASFQRSRGLPDHGRLTRGTVRAMSDASSRRLLAEIIANMERWRWLPRDLGETHVFVNVPEYLVRVVHEGDVVLKKRVIVGKTKNPTPVFSDRMEYLVVNPWWNVPQSIVKKEMLPVYNRDATYFERKGYEATPVGETFRVRQPPGPRNALGRIKFMFPNRHSVYLHDTPSRSLFRRSVRAFSHGCVRVQNPFELAETLLKYAQSPKRRYSKRRLRGMIGRTERTIRLQTKIPVHIVYFTAFVDADGELAIRRDIYGFSARLRRMMGIKG